MRFMFYIFNERTIFKFLFFLKNNNLKVINISKTIRVQRKSQTLNIVPYCVWLVTHFGGWCSRYLVLADVTVPYGT